MNNNKLENKKVIVTGGAGFIGSHLCEELVKINANVISIDDMSAGHQSNTELLKNNNNFKFVNKSVTDTNGMDELFDGAYAIFHNAASKKNICDKDPKKDLNVNAEGALNLLEYSKKHKVERFIHASTGSVYGEPSIFPSTEDHPLSPVSYYGVSKLAGERYVDVFNHLYGLKTTILRYFHIYGPRQESNEFGGVVSIFLRNALAGTPLVIFGDGKQIRSFTWVKDLVSINLKAAVADEAVGQVYNAVSGIQISVLDLAKKIVEITGSKSEIVHGERLLGDIDYFDVSNQKVSNELGIEFEKDFWGTLECALSEYKKDF